MLDSILCTSSSSSRQEVDLLSKLGSNIKIADQAAGGWARRASRILEYRTWVSIPRPPTLLKWAELGLSSFQSCPFSCTSSSKAVIVMSCNGKLVSESPDDLAESMATALPHSLSLPVATRAYGGRSCAGTVRNRRPTWGSAHPQPTPGVESTAWDTPSCPCLQLKSIQVSFPKLSLSWLC